MADDDYYGSGDRERDLGWQDSGAETGSRVGEPPRGWGCVSWLVILALVGLLLALREVKVEQVQPFPPLDDTPASMQGLLDLQVRALIGLGELYRQTKPGSDAEIRVLFEGNPADAADQAEHAAMWSRGTLGQRMQFAIAGGELSGPEAARNLLGKLKWDWEVMKLKPSAEQLAVFDSLRKLYRDYGDKEFDAPTVNAAERERLLKKLGWYGRLALTPPKAPDQVTRNKVLEAPLRLVYGLVGIVLFMLALGVCGLIGLVAFAIGTGMGGVRVGLREGSGSSGIYAETFAIWLFFYFAGLMSIELWPRGQDRFLLNLAVMFGSLAVLFWPVMRGISWSQVRQDLGLTRGRAGLLEPLVGIPSYAMMLPMLAVGFTLTVIMIFVWLANNGGQAAAPASPFEPRQMLSHPIVQVVLQGGFWLRLQLFFLACVAAPIVEEIMFRGVLYRQLRDATRGLGWLGSCLVSGLWGSFIFAVIHPQGMVAVPALMGIACGCTLAREWRDSLWASMVVHAISNSLIFTLLMLGTM